MDAAVRSEDLKLVQDLIRSGANVNEPCSVGDGVGSLLILAIVHGHKDIALALLSAGADVHTKDSTGSIPLHWACRKGLKEVVRALIDGGSRINEQDSLGRTPLVLADEQGDELTAMILLQAGANCSEGFLELPETGLFLRACRECDLLTVRVLLKNGCKIRKLSEAGHLQLLANFSIQVRQNLLHHACHKGDVFVVRTLLKNGCSVSILSTEAQEELLSHACHEGDVFVARILLENGCRIRNISTEEQEMCFSQTHDKMEQDAFVAGTLLKNGCSVETLLMNDHGVSSILSKEEKETLLHCACQEGDLYVACFLLKIGCSVKKLTKADFIFLVDNLSKQELEELLLCACRKGELFAVESLASECNLDCVDSIGYTPLMNATANGHVKVVRKLILAGANPGMQTTAGALHIAAIYNDIPCGILLAEGGASVRTKNESGLTPLDLAKPEFKEAIKQALSFTTRKALCIIGNAESGKSTLITALQAESNSFLGKIFNQFRRVSDSCLRTAGINIVPHCSLRYGDVLFFDFAGQDDYHGPHQMFLESLLSKPGVLMTLLMVVKLTEEEDAILHQLHRWLYPVALMATPASPPQVIAIGSFLDKVRSKEVATAKLIRCIEAIRKDLQELPIEFVGSCVLNCRQPQSKGIDQLCCFLQKIPIPEFRATHTCYSFAWVLSRIRSSFTAQAVQLQEFSMWVQDNKDNLPRTMPSPEEVCQDLSAAGHALYLPNREDPSKSWLVLDLPSILHDVYGTLFSQSKENVNEFGLLHCHHLTELFPHLDQEMVQQLLISLEFCLPVNPSTLKLEVSKLTQSNEISGWLFFPALISAKPPQSLGILLQPSDQCLCWQLRTAKKHSISASVLQTILLRLAAHFVVKHHLSEGAQQHCCRIWWNGIAWQSKKDVDVIVHIVDNRVIQVICVNLTSAGKSCQYMIDVISDILSTVNQLSPKLAADSYIVHPPPPRAVKYEEITTLPPQELIPVADIQNSIEYGEDFTLSLKGRSSYHSTKARVSEVFGGHTPSLEDIKRITWTQPEPNLAPQPPTESNMPEPNQPEASLPQTPTGPNQPEPPTGPNQPEPLPQTPSGLNQPGPSLPQTPPGQDQPESLTVAPTNSKKTPSAQALLEVLSTPDMRDVDELIVTPVAASWQKVALRLGVELSVIKIVSRNHPNDCEGACQDVLDRWLRGEQYTGGKERLWSTLLNALTRADFVELERRLQREHFHQVISL